MRQLSLETLGQFARSGLKGLAQLLKTEKAGQLSAKTRERMRFEEEVREQFVKLKEKGLSISVFTL